MYAPNFRYRWVKRLPAVLVFILVFTVATTGARPFTVAASEYNASEYNASEYNSEHSEYYDFDRMFDVLIVSFDPAPGVFPASETSDGIRYPNRGETMTNFPPNPTRDDGYVFGGWRLPGGDVLTATYLIVNSNMELSAIWVRQDEAPEATTTPPPEATPAPTPYPGASPSPAPPTPSPTPNPDDKAQDAQRPNPGTNPIAISFIIFGAVIGLGMAAFSIVKLTAKHAVASDKYRTDKVRYDRETRLREFLEDEDVK